MERYEVVEDTRILHNGKVYLKGDEISLDKSDAANLGVFVKLIDKKVIQKVKADNAEPATVTESATAPESATTTTPVAKPRTAKVSA